MPRKRQRQGNVRRRGHRYQAQVRLEDGSRPAKSFDTEADAWKWIAVMKADDVRGVLGKEEERPPMCFEDLCRLYVDHKMKRWREGMARFFKGHLKSTLLPKFGERLIHTITTKELQQFVNDQLGRVSGVTVDKYIQCLKAVFKYAVAMDYLEKAPIGDKKVEGPGEEEEKDFRVLTPQELRAIYLACVGWQKLFFGLLIFAGLRRAEVYRCQADWFQLEGKTLYIRKAKRKSNKMPMPAPVREAFLELGDVQGYLFRRRRSPGTVASGAEKQDREATDKRKTLWSVLERAGVKPKGVTFHTFRRSFLSLLERLPGVSYSIVKALGRHGKNKSDVTARYLKPPKKDLRRAMRRLVKRILREPPVKNGEEPRQVVGGSLVADNPAGSAESEKPDLSEPAPRADLEGGQRRNR